MKMLALLLVGISAWFLAGCGDSHSSHDHSSHGGGAEHSHTAPHGGTLVELGQHAFNVEFVRDLEAGKLIAYILDAHAEFYLRLPIPSFEVTLMKQGQPETLKLAAVENSKTGEKVGDTSQFEAQADWLKVASPLAGEIKELDLRGSKFSGVKFQLPGK
jgi:hypothetical protein